MRLLLTTLLLCITACSWAQGVIERLQTPVKGAVVAIHQSDDITKLIQGSSRRPSIAPTTHPNVVTLDANGQYVTVAKKAEKARGYRIQVYAGNNSREAKNAATAMAAKVRAAFPELSTYVTFQSPRWLCRVGDFETAEEAQEKMRELRKVGGFKEVAIVKDQINIFVDF